MISSVLLVWKLICLLLLFIMFEMDFMLGIVYVVFVFLLMIVKFW